MKKVITFLFLAMILHSCTSGKGKLDKITSKVYIGMTISEFNKIVPKKQLVEMRKDITVYKVSRQVWYDSDGSGGDLRFFYFIDGKLSSIDEGERAVDYRIKID
jgi:hypothetical protein